MRITIGTPVYLGIHPEVVKDIIALDINAQKERNELRVHFPKGTILSQSRNMIMRQALEENADWVLMWDSDISISDKSFLMGMIEAARETNAPVVGLPVILQDGNTYNAANKEASGYKNYTKLDNFIEQAKKPFETDVIGTGVLLINMAWIRDHFLKGPWFSTTDTETGCFPEDWFFCERVKERGGKIIVDPRFKTIHYKEQGLSW